MWADKETVALLGWTAEFGTGHMLHSLTSGSASKDVLQTFPHRSAVCLDFMSFGTQYATAVYTYVLDF